MDEQIILGVWNPKGGTGKTTLSLNLAGAFAGAGRRVLLIDLDPQLSAFSIAGGADIGFEVIDYQPRQRPVADVVIIDHPPGVGLPHPRGIVMPTTLDPLTWHATQRGRKEADSNGKQTLLVPNRVDTNRTEEREALAVIKEDHGDLRIVKNRSIYPRSLGHKQTVFGKSGFVDKFYGIREARQEMISLRDSIVSWYFATNS